MRGSHLILPMLFRVVLSIAVALSGTGGALATAPQSPVILEPKADNAVVSPFDVHMAIEESFSDPDSDFLASTDWEIRRANDNALQWSAYGISDLRIWHVHFGDGTFAETGRTALDAQTAYLLRVRFNDTAGEPSEWTERPFVTGRLEEIFALQLTDIETRPAPAWVDLVASGEILLPPSATPHTLRLESCCGELFYRQSGPSPTAPGSTENPPATAQDKPLRVTLVAGSGNLALPASRISFTDGRSVNRRVYLPRVNLAPGQAVSFWISVTGSSYNDESGTNEPTFGTLAQGAPVSWVAEKPGYIVEVVSTGYQLPTAICFVPRPSAEPTAPKFYVAELYGKIKVVAQDGTVSDFASNLLDYEPQTSFPGRGEMGVADVAVHPATGEIFVTMTHAIGDKTYGGVYRLPSNDGGRTITSAPQRIFSTYPAETLQSHQISNISFDENGDLLVHNGDGFTPSAAAILSDPRGKILRMSATGEPVPANPFFDAEDGINFTDYVFSYGYRNPFGGEWRRSDRALYVVENGTNANDRLSRADAGQSYGWNGNDSSMTNRAIHNWVTPVAPVQMTFIQSSVFEGSNFPSSALERAYITESGPTYAAGPQANGKRVTMFDIGPDGQKLSGPDTLVSYQGSGRSTAAAITAGPDGIYFSDLYKETGSNPVAAGANILRIRFVGAADFTMENNTGAPPLSVSFTDTSTIPEPGSWLWDFGDGATSTERNPVHTYNQAGTFSVRLTVTGPDGAALAVKSGAVVVGDKKHILMVTGNSSLNAAETLIQQRLLASNYDVTHLVDNLVTTEDAENKSMVLICSSVLSANVGTKFRTVNVPVLCYESYLFDDLGMTGTIADADYGTRPQQTRLILSDDAADPLVRDLESGEQTITVDPTIFTWGRPPADAKISAFLADSNQAGIFRFENGAPMVGGFTAPARRLGLMLEDLTAQSLTSTGWTLVERAVAWTSNLAPRISLPSPLPGSRFRLSDPVSVLAEAADFDGEVVKVEYYADDVLIGTTTTAPHTLLWQPEDAGVYVLTAVAHDDQESTLRSGAVRIEVLRSFDYWLQQYFTEAQLQDPSVGGPHGDPDLDGLANLLEYALGGSPWQFGRQDLELGIDNVSGRSLPSFTYTTVAGSETRVFPEVASSMEGPWESGPDFVSTETLNDGDGYTRIRARATRPLAESEGRVFFRLRSILP